MLYTRKTLSVEATRWFQNGDHPLDYVNPRIGCGISMPAEIAEQLGLEGELVKRFNAPGFPPEATCASCGQRVDAHGAVSTPSGAAVVCPGDWIVTGVDDVHYPVKNTVFTTLYQPNE